MLLLEVHTPLVMNMSVTLSVLLLSGKGADGGHFRRKAGGDGSE